MLKRSRLPASTAVCQSCIVNISAFEISLSPIANRLHSISSRTVVGQLATIFCDTVSPRFRPSNRIAWPFTKKPITSTSTSDDLNTDQFIHLMISCSTLLGPYTDLVASLKTDAGHCHDCVTVEDVGSVPCYDAI